MLFVQKMQGLLELEVDVDVMEVEAQKADVVEMVDASTIRPTTATPMVVLATQLTLQPHATILARIMMSMQPSKTSVEVALVGSKIKSEMMG